MPITPIAHPTVIPVQNPAKEEVAALEVDTKVILGGSAEAVIDELEVVRFANV